MHQRVLNTFVPFDAIVLFVGVCSHVVTTSVNMLIYKSKKQKFPKHSISREWLINVDTYDKTTKMLGKF